MQSTKPAKRIQDRRQRGQSAVEFAMLLPVFLATTLGLIDVGRAYFQNHVVLDAARAAARVGSLPTTSQSDVIGAASEILTGAGVEGWDVQAVKAGTDGQPGDTTMITVKAPFDTVSGTFIPVWSGRIWLEQTVKARHE